MMFSESIKDADARNDPSAAVYTGVLPTRRAPRWARAIGRIVFGVVAVASVVSATAFSFASGSTGTDPRSSLTLIAPAGVGGGWDGFAREQQQAMRLDGIANNVQVVNIPGAGGTIGLSSFVTMEGQSNTLLATGAAMLGGIVMNDSPVDLTDVRPIARIAEDYAVFIVHADAPWDTVDEFAAAWAGDHGGIRFTGGSAGSIDHLLVAQFAQVEGIAPSDITYIPKSGGGEAIQTLLSGTADVAVTGYNEVADQIDAGRVKPLAISAPQRLADVDIPTFEELGYGVDLVNWRGLVAVPGIADEDFDAVKAIVDETAESEAWADALARNRWVDSYLDGEELERFLVEDQQRTAELVKELGL
ncbi:tripartite tricarboxylate transporter substrate-binding protein [Microbacterium betulae]|uniref:Tripartite tricarboxylate transporter substrate-binding protein n=1 Tax=Microbacterium betulae TaxID=2981139 RepID=A0AA97FIB6_9MICO|nr:tripartite tricarboxylate transporter substrate-binding protein [Microbacterium sp. AB]WOF23575.1 tripartite tricarboxylate transporter substrate-binding protein [Microbacterium sp. AB]